jgi:hypothetical protein
LYIGTGRLKAVTVSSLTFVVSFLALQLPDLLLPSDFFSI